MNPYCANSSLQPKAVHHPTDMLMLVDVVLMDNSADDATLMSCFYLYEMTRLFEDDALLRPSSAGY